MKKSWFAASVALIALVTTAEGPAYARPATAPSAATAASEEAGRHSRHPYEVRPGITLTNPLNRTRDDINVKVLDAINHARKGSTIRLVSWNFDSWPYVNALTRAHNRGVSVRLIMARGMAVNQGPKAPYWTLRRNLQGAGNERRPAELRSWTRTCSHSCRGRGGSMHAKYFVFSKTGRSKYVVMNSSANLTAAAARIQWNDMYTTVGREKIYDEYMKTFREASRDRPAKYRQFKDGTITGFFFPLGGRAHPAMRMLNRVQCHGARTTSDGRTVVRAAQDVFNNKIGLVLARKLRELHRQGCDVKVVYSQAVGETRPVVKSIPHNHLVQDRDGDGSYDRYLHSKVLTISGHYNGNPRTRIVLNGSANWSGTAIQSDEQGMIIERDGVEKRYTRWINQMYRTHLVSAPYDPALDEDAERRRGPVDPYAEMER